MDSASTRFDGPSRIQTIGVVLFYTQLSGLFVSVPSGQQFIIQPSTKIQSRARLQNGMVADAIVEKNTYTGAETLISLCAREVVPLFADSSNRSDHHNHSSVNMVTFSESSDSTANGGAVLHNFPTYSGASANNSNLTSNNLSNNSNHAMHLPSSAMVNREHRLSEPLVGRPGNHLPNFQNNLDHFGGSDHLSSGPNSPSQGGIDSIPPNGGFGGNIHLQSTSSAATMSDDRNVGMMPGMNAGSLSPSGPHQLQSSSQGLHSMSIGNNNRLMSTLSSDMISRNSSHSSLDALDASTSAFDVQFQSSHHGLPSHISTTSLASSTHLTSFGQSTLGNSVSTPAGLNSLANMSTILPGGGHTAGGAPISSHGSPLSSPGFNPNMNSSFSQLGGSVVTTTNNTGASPVASSMALRRSVALTREFSISVPERPSDAICLPKGYMLGRVDINVDEIGVISVFDMNCRSPSWTAMCPNRPLFVAVFETSGKIHERSVGNVVAFRPLFINGRAESQISKRLPPQVMKAVETGELESIDAVPRFIYRSDNQQHQRFAPRDLVTWPQSWLTKDRPYNPTVADINTESGSTDEESIVLLSVDHPDADRYVGTVVAIDVQALGSKPLPSPEKVDALPWTKEVSKEVYSESYGKALSIVRRSPTAYTTEFIQGNYYLGVVYSVYTSSGYGFLKVLDSFGPNAPCIEKNTLFTDHPFRPLAQGLEVYFRLQNHSNGPNSNNNNSSEKPELPNRGDLVLFSAHWHSNSRPQARKMKILAKHQGTSCVGVTVAMTARLSILLPCEPLFMSKGSYLTQGCDTMTNCLSADDVTNNNSPVNGGGKTSSSMGENSTGNGSLNKCSNYTCNANRRIAANDLALRNELVFVRCNSGARDVCHYVGESVAVVVDPDITTCLRGRVIRALDVRPPTGGSYETTIPEEVDDSNISGLGGIPGLPTVSSGFINPESDVTNSMIWDN